MQKTATSTGVTKYTLHGKNIVHMTQGSNELHFFYDAQNKPAVVVYNGTPYTYVKNLQGDIVAILDSTGSIVVEYKYDAWGKPFTPTGSMKDDLGKLNPFRYRGYVYDEETGLYYLRTRYYNPTCCRFINMDSVLLKGLLVSNQQAYCCNNPVLHTDSNGRSIWEDIWNLFCDTVNASQEIEQYNIQASHSAWQQAGEIGADVLSSFGSLTVDTINANQEIERYNMNLELYATKRYMYQHSLRANRQNDDTTCRRNR